jgi:Ca-activated chloride channel homolog
MKTRRLCALAAAALAAATEARAQAGLLVPTSTGLPDPAVLSLREMAIDVGIARGYARVNVRQVYENHTGAIQEGTYRFALPPSGAVGDFAVWDGLVRIPGVILEKQRARAIYRELTMQRIDPGLLQQGEEDGGEGGEGAEGAPSGRPSGGALFSVTVAPIPPHATKRLELQFQQEVPVIRRQGEFRLALAPPDGEPPVAARLSVRVKLEDGEAAADEDALPLTREGALLVFEGTGTPLARDLVVRFTTPADAPPLRVSAFRNPSGSLPDGVALAPWERPSELPPEKDGFLLVEALPPGDAPAARAAQPGAPARAAAAARPPLALAVLFDTSLSHRWSGLEAGYASLTQVLAGLGAQDRFALIPFDRRPDAEPALRAATPEAVEAALTRLRARPLGAGTDVAAAVTAARALAGEGGRIVLVTDGMGSVTSKALERARGGAPLFTILTGTEAGEAFRSGSTQVLASTATDIETQLFFERLVSPPAAAAALAPRKKVGEPVPFQVKGGDPQLRDVYPVMVQPLEPGSLSGWVGRYGAPQAQLEFLLPSPLFAGGRATAAAALPETALEARDLPRRWARARVDHLLALIEAEGEKKEWIDEIIELSKRYKFVTPYTAFLAAPRSLLRPRRIQPGDPVLRVECDAGTRSVVALFPFGLRLPLVKRPGTRLWEGRFLVPEGIADGRYAVRIVLRDGSGARITETKHFVLDGTAPRIRPDALAAAAPGARVRVAVRADEDVIVLSARLGDGPPVPLRWDAAARRSVGELRVPALAVGAQEVVFEAMDGAKNVGFARTRLEVRP